ncbi:hypothetical protein BGZ92_000018 [Podila epicladia]|nr:hypothetical protein BGZ92_000018 [Podila epicladia]
MHYLGVPTTRALCVMGSDLPVRREQIETAAITTRIAPSFAYRARLVYENLEDTERVSAMNCVNPQYILRNHLAEQAIELAKEKDFSEVERLLKVLRSPFDASPEYEAYAQLPPTWAASLQVSCSS